MKEKVKLCLRFVIGIFACAIAFFAYSNSKEWNHQISIFYSQSQELGLYATFHYVILFAYAILIGVIGILEIFLSGIKSKYNILRLCELLIYPIFSIISCIGNFIILSFADPINYYLLVLSLIALIFALVAEFNKKFKGQFFIFSVMCSLFTVIIGEKITFQSVLELIYFTLFIAYFITAYFLTSNKEVISKEYQDDNSSKLKRRTFVMKKYCIILLLFFVLDIVLFTYYGTYLNNYYQFVETFLTLIFIEIPIYATLLLYEIRKRKCDK